MINDGYKDTIDDIDSFLMIGQSNMAGRGDFGEVPDIVNPNCFMLRMGRWQPMSEPINTDRATRGGFQSGVGLAASFADAYAKETGRKVGLIPCADGGTSLWQWMPGMLLYDHAVMQTKLAMRTSNLKGILWHQGENDCNSDETVVAYTDKFVKMITTMRQELSLPDIPVIMGELSANINRDYNARIGEMNKNFAKIPGLISNIRLVSAEGLTLKSDGIHFNSASYRVFGLRYFEAFKEFI